MPHDGIPESVFERERRLLKELKADPRTDDLSDLLSPTMRPNRWSDGSNSLNRARGWRAEDQTPINLRKPNGLCTGSQKAVHVQAL
jgi:hypothetical protein